MERKQKEMSGAPDEILEESLPGCRGLRQPESSASLVADVDVLGYVSLDFLLEKVLDASQGSILPSSSKERDLMGDVCRQHWWKFECFSTCVQCFVQRFG